MDSMKNNQLEEEKKEDIFQVDEFEKEAKGYKSLKPSRWEPEDPKEAVIIFFCYCNS